MSSVLESIQSALSEGKILEDTANNLTAFLSQPSLKEYERTSIQELVERNDWTELNDRFYRTLKFGTGGIRGRTIGKVTTKAEQGTPTDLDRPEFPTVGTNVMNYYNVSRATQGVCRYLKANFTDITPSIVIYHDTRHFSREFAELAAGIATEMGVNAFLFNEERSTPQLSFSVRELDAQAGVVITASHNPPHDNGYKVYFADGGQIVEPHASGIIKEVLSIESAEVANADKASTPGTLTTVGEENDEAYMEAMSSLVLEPETVAAQKDSLKLVFTSIHGTGTKIVPKILEKFGFNVETVAEQAAGDGRFPTVKSPNPENAEALEMGLQLTKKLEADVLFGTDPDADRMGVIARRSDGEYELLNGNQIGSLMAEYRLQRMFKKGWITKENAGNATLIKTFVTTDLQKEIADSYGVKCIETLTGFKYIGSKLNDYAEQAGGKGDLSAQEWRNKLLTDSTFFVFGGEESYGYCGGDYVRDKDANASVLMFAELAAWCRSQGKTVVDYLYEIYAKYGCFMEKLGTLTFEGAEGAAKIQKLLSTYKENTPTEWAGLKVERMQNFAEEEIFDTDGKKIPSELMLIFHLEGGNRIAVRASGTEPKIKYYFFARQAAEGEITPVLDELRSTLSDRWDWSQKDIEARVG